MRFLLVDHIIEMEPGLRARGIKNVTLSEDFFTHHFPEYPVMPGALITECLVQLADWTVRESEAFAFTGLPSSFESVKFHHLVRPGDRLQLEVEVVDRQPGLYAFRGEARCEDKVVTVARFVLKTQCMENLMASEEARRLYKVICRTN